MRVLVVAVVLLAFVAIGADAARLDQKLRRQRAQTKAKGPADWTISATDQYGASANPVWKAVSVKQQTITKRKYPHGYLSWFKAGSVKLKLAPNEAVAAKLVDKGAEADNEWTALQAIFGHCPAFVPKPYDRFDATGGTGKEYQITEAITGQPLLNYAIGNFGLLKKAGKTMLQALDCIHTKAKYLHRDIKLPNILLDSNNNPRIIDFGEALPVGTDWTVHDLPLQQTVQYEASWGPANCKAPTICTAAMRQAAEVYAIGITLLQMLFGTGANELIDAIGFPPTTIPSLQGQAAFKTLFASTDLAAAITAIPQKLKPIGPSPTGTDYPHFVAAIKAMCAGPTVTAAQALALPFFT